VGGCRTVRYQRRCEVRRCGHLRRVAGSRGPDDKHIGGAPGSPFGYTQNQQASESGTASAWHNLERIIDLLIVAVNGGLNRTGNVGDSDLGNEDGVTARRYTPEERAQAVRLVRTLRDELGTSHGTVQRIANQLGYGVESVRAWVHDEAWRGASWESNSKRVAGFQRRLRIPSSPPIPPPNNHWPFRAQPVISTTVGRHLRFVFS
jgi:transposase-like protein